MKKETVDKNKGVREKKWNWRRATSKQIIFVLWNWKLLEILWIQFDFRMIAFSWFWYFFALLQWATGLRYWRCTMLNVKCYVGILHTKHRRTQIKWWVEKYSRRCEHLCPCIGFANHIHMCSGAKWCLLSSFSSIESSMFRYFHQHSMHDESFLSAWHFSSWKDLKKESEINQLFLSLDSHVNLMH